MTPEIIPNRNPFCLAVGRACLLPRSLKGLIGCALAVPVKLLVNTLQIE